MAPEHRAEALPSVPKCKRAVMCLTEKMGVLDKLPTGMHYIESSVTKSINRCL